MVEPVYVALGKIIRRWRLQRGWTQEELADAVGYSRAQLANVELGWSRLSVHMIYDIAQVLHVEPRRMFPSRDEIRRKSKTRTKPRRRN
jgi:transcriptional regulator with XRE-family HTH domain